MQRMLAAERLILQAMNTLYSCHPARCYDEPIECPCSPDVPFSCCCRGTRILTVTGTMVEFCEVCVQLVC